MQQNNLKNQPSIKKLIVESKILKIAAVILASIILVVSLIYFNFYRSKDAFNPNNTRIVLKTILQGIGSAASDTDQDKVLEPPAAASIDDKLSNTIGLYIPAFLSSNRTNAMGKPYIYCAWDFGSITDPARYWVMTNANGQEAKQYNPPPTFIVAALIDPGPNGQYETRCPDITSPNKSLGDDVVQTLNLDDLEKLTRQNKPLAKKISLTCAFGQVYKWVESSNSWQCLNPPKEITAAMPTGCPKGQVLLQRNDKIRCEDSRVITGEAEHDTILHSDNAAKVVISTNAIQPTSTQRPKLESSDTSLPPPGSEKLQPQSQANGNSVTSASPNPSTTTRVTASANANDTMLTITSTPTAIQTTASINETGSLTPSASFLPGEDLTINARIENEALLNQGIEIKDGKNIVSTVNDNNKIEIEIKKSKKNFKWKSCSPWLYLNRSLGVVNQCIRLNSFADKFGVAAGMTSWPSSMTFVQGAYIFCPRGNFGEKPNCQNLSFDKPGLNSEFKNSIFKQDGFVCSRMWNPLPPPWPQYESFIFSEFLPHMGTCRIDQAPLFTTDQKLVCVNLSTIIDAYTHDGYCGCGWSLMWNPYTGKLECH